jgi:hypothetical protein
LLTVCFVLSLVTLFVLISGKKYDVAKKRFYEGRCYQLDYYDFNHRPVDGPEYVGVLLVV